MFNLYIFTLKIGYFEKDFWKGTILTNAERCAKMGAVDASGASPKKRKKENEASKNEKMERGKNTGFIVFDFMIEELHLSGVALLVFSLIYSFTRVGSECYGSLEYISERIGASRASVCRALKELVKKNYIEKRKSRDFGKISYVALYSLELQNETEESANCDCQSLKMTPNNKENNKENKELTTMYHSINKLRANYPEMYFGTEKVVRMTLHKYVNLLRAIGVLETLRYIRVLEGRIISQPTASYKNHYKTIITWAREDGLISPEGEIILEN